MAVDVVVGYLVAQRFSIEAAAVSGGMGSVYRARDLLTGLPVALKLVHVSGGALEAERFAREAQLLAELRHPNIVAHVAHGVMDSGAPFLAMEWLEGEDLAGRLAQGPLSLGESLVLLRRAAEALAVAHRRGVVHRDLKPNNIFLRGGSVDRATLLDFGIARHVAQTRGLTRTGAILGTPSYMAPEQASGQRLTSTSTDVFSLGCVLFECLTGRPPYVAEHLVAVLSKILFEEPPRLRSVCPNMPEPLEALLDAMLTRDPDLRLRDADQLLVALAGLGDMAGHTAATAAPESPRPALSTRELSLVCVLIASEITATANESTLDASDETSRCGQIQTLSSTLDGLGVRVALVGNASLVATVDPGRGSATDQAAQAARCALLVKERWEKATVTLATGRGVTGGHVPVGEAIDRAWALLGNRTTTADQAATAGPAAQVVLIDELTAGLLDARFEITVTQGGVHLLHRERADVDASRLLLGKPTPCVGRDRELAMLDGLLTVSREDSVAHAVLLTAPPGAGKSRLRHEFVRRLAERHEDVEILLGRGDPLSAGSSYGLIAQAIRQLCEIHQGDALPLRQARLRQRVRRHLGEPAATRVEEFIGELCAVPFDDEHSAPLRAARQDPRVMSDQVEQALLDLLRAECATRPLLIILEDLHWSDALTVRLIDVVLRDLPEAPLMVLALARPEVTDVFPSLWVHRRIHKLRLDRLGKKACERLISLVLGPGASAQTIASIVERSTGNALFLEELIRAAAFGKGEEPPPTVMAMLQARFLRMDPTPRRVLRLASIFGQEFPRDGLLALFGPAFGDAAVDTALRVLADAELIERCRDGQTRDADQYTMRHALFRDAAYGLLTEEDRRAGHRQVGEFLVGLGERDPAVLAEHFQLGGELERAAVYYTRAADLAIAGNDLEGALALTTRGLACGPEPSTRGALLACETMIHFWRAELPAADRCGTEALELLEAGGRRWCSCIGAMFLTVVQLNQVPRFEPLTAAFNAVEPAEDARIAYLEAGSILVLMFTCVGVRAPVRAFLARMEAICTDASIAEASSHGWLKYSAAFYTYLLEPDPWAAYVDGKLAAAWFEKAGDRRMTASALSPLGVLEAELVGLAAAEETLRAGLTLLEKLEATLVFGYMAMNLAYLLADQGPDDRLADARALAVSVIDRVGETTIYSGTARAALALIDTREGALASAEAHARQGRTILGATPGMSGPAFVAQIEVLLAQRRTAEARAVADEGLTMIRTIGGAGSYEIRLRLAAAEARHADGAHDLALETIREALTELRMRADRIPDPAARTYFLEGAPPHIRVQALARAWEHGESTHGRHEIGTSSG